MIKHRGWTEKVYMFNLLYAMLVVQEILVLTCLFPNSAVADTAGIIIPAVFAEVATFSGFIIWKNKSENLSKHNKQYKGGITV